MPVDVLLGGVCVLLCATCLGAAAPRSAHTSKIVYSVCIGFCIVALALAIWQLLAAPESVTRRILPIGLPWLGAHFRIDALAALFLGIVNLGGAAASLFALGYAAHEHAPGRVLPFYPAFLAGMNVVIIADDAFTFLFAWEFMSLASWGLVISHHTEIESRRAGYVYLLMASFGTLCLLLAFGLLAGPEGRYAFADVVNGTRDPWRSDLILLLALLGTGSKAGLVPLHVWLPLAHPAAPSHVSALMSGVMTKVAIYAFARLIFDLAGPPAWWWSMLVLCVGAITAVLGVLSALLQTDIKRLLAWSTIENIGVIFVALGLALAFKGNGMPGPAALAFTAALLHAINHSLFKSLLFFGAGAVVTAAATRDIEKLGGLIHRMPLTAFLVLGGCLAISALPPLNGFVSEWLVFQAVLTSPALPQWSLKLAVPAAGAILALSAALSAACFVRMFGISFLGRPRTPIANAAAESNRYALIAMGILLGLCVAIGILPGWPIDALAPVAKQLVGQSMPVQNGIAWSSIIPIAESRSSYNGLLVLIFITVCTLISIEAIHRLASRRVRRAPAWDCGYPDPSTATQYSAESFVQPIRRVFGPTVFGASEHVDMPAPGDMRRAGLVVVVRDFVWDTIYVPLEVWIARTAQTLNHLQFLTIRKYLSLVFGLLVALLLVLSLWS